MCDEEGDSRMSDDDGNEVSDVEEEVKIPKDRGKGNRRGRGRGCSGPRANRGRRRQKAREMTNEDERIREEDHEQSHAVRDSLNETSVMEQDKVEINDNLVDKIKPSRISTRGRRSVSSVKTNDDIKHSQSVNEEKVQNQKQPDESFTDKTESFEGKPVRRPTRRKGSQPTFEEPPGSPFFSDEEDDESLDAHPTSDTKDDNTNKLSDLPPIGNDCEDSDSFHGFPNNCLEWDDNSTETPVIGRAESGNEDKLVNERETNPRRGRGRRSTQWKRGRRRKSPSNTQLPEDAMSGLPDYLKSELQHAYEIYLALRSLSKIGPFLERPSFNMFGMSTYYNVIKTPMWLLEVKRKLLCQGYRSISEFVFDLKLMIDNCYKFWGQDHAFSKGALQIRSKLEQKIQSLPSELRDKCQEVLLLCDENNDILNMDPDDFRNTQYEAYDSIKNKSKSDDLSQEVKEKRKEEMLSWERSQLVKAEDKNLISTFWELAAIGIFFNETHEFFNIERFRQYEIERMLLIPEESSTLATIMTTLLCPSTMRNELDATVPIMSYKVWNKKLKKKIGDWFTLYYNKSANERETFQSCGVEPHFWKAMSYTNHYEDKEFSEMTFQQRCTIIKALCDHLCFTIKDIQDILSDECLDEVLEYTKKAVLGHLDNYTYFLLPFWPDVRIYRTKNITTQQVEATRNLSLITGKLLNCIVTKQSRDVSNDVSKSDLFEDFSLVVDSPDDLFALTEQVKCLNVEMTSKLRSLNLQAKKQFRPYLSILSSMYDQWTSYRSRIALMDSESIKFWERFDMNTNEKGYFDVEEPEVLGKRTRKPTALTASNDLTSSEENEDVFDHDDEGSDWECPSEKKKSVKKQSKENLSDALSDTTEPKTKKARLSKSQRMKKSKNDIETKAVKNDSSATLSPSVVIEKVLSLSDNKKLLNETSVGDDGTVIIKTEPGTVCVKTEYEDGSGIDIKEEIKIENKVKSITDVKKEIKQEVNVGPVITLSSEDENDDVIITTPVKQIVKPLSQPSPAAGKQPLGNNVMQTAVRSPLTRSPLITSPRISSPNSNPRLAFTPSPRLNTQRQMSPRMSPSLTPRQRAQSPMQQSFTPPMMSPRTRGVPPRFPAVPTRPSGPPQVSRNLFNNARPNQSPQNQKAGGIQAKLTFGKRDDGSYGYLARLPDGGVINISPQQVDTIKKKYGHIPPVISIPI